jgi:hypothetical protein
MVHHLRGPAAVGTNLSSLGLSFARMCRTSTLSWFDIFDRNFSLCGIRLTACYRFAPLAQPRLVKCFNDFNLRSFNSSVRL